MKLYSLTTVLVCTVFLLGCGAKFSGSNPLFTGTWYLSELEGVPVQQSGTTKDANLVFTFDGRNVTGSGGCNRLVGVFDADAKGKMEFGKMATTQMACNDLAFEDRFLAAISKVKHYNCEENTLYLKDDDNKVIAVFKNR